MVCTNYWFYHQIALNWILEFWLTLYTTMNYKRGAKRVFLLYVQTNTKETHKKYVISLSNGTLRPHSKNQSIQEGEK